MHYQYFKGLIWVAVNFLLTPPIASAQDIQEIIINEIDSDTPGTDVLEFIELYDGGVGNTSLDGLVVVFFNGNGDVAYATFDLDGFETDADGFFVLGNPGASNVDSTFRNSLLQNGPDAVALYLANNTDFPDGASVTTANLVDAIVYGTSPTPGLLVLLNAGQSQVSENSGGDAANHSLQRIPNGSGGARNTRSFLAIPPTPGAENSLPTPNLVSTPVSIYFGRVQTGREKEQTLVLSNTGLADLEIKSTRFAGSAAEQFALVDLTLPLILEPAESQPVAVRFTPRTPGNKSARLEIFSNDPDANPFLIKFRGEGEAAPRVALSTDFLDFGSVEVGGEVELSLLIKNEGFADLEIDKIRLTGIHDHQWFLKNAVAPLTIEPNESFDLVLSFKPSAVGDKTAALEISSNDPPKVVTLTGNAFKSGPSPFAGVVVINEIHYNPASAQGSDAVFEFIELANTSGEPIALEQFSFSAGVSHTFSRRDTLPANGFVIVAVDSTAYPGSIQWQSGNLVNSGELIQLIDPDGVTVDSVFYDDESPWPTTSNGGGPSLELKHPLLDNSIAENWQASFRLGGTPGAANSTPDTTASGPQIAVSPTNLNFGDVPVGNSKSLPFTISNTGDAELEVTSVILKSSDSFTLNDAPVPPLMIAPGASQNIEVTYTPTRAGVDSGVVEIASNDANTPLATVTLTGRGTADSLSEFAGVVVINEIHYNPSTTQGSDADFEFLELHNSSDEPISLAGFAFTAGIAHTFQAGDTLPARGYLVLASNSANYPGSIPWDSGSLLNTGEAIQLLDGSGATVDFVEYNDTRPWPTAAHGGGPSLELIDPLLDNNLPENWQASFSVGGSPGRQNFLSDPTAVVEPAPAPPVEFVLAQNYPNPFNPTTQIGFVLPVASVVTLTIFDITGREIRKLIAEENREAGAYSVRWNGTDDVGIPAATGIYLYHIVIQPNGGGTPVVLTRKMLLIK